MYSKSVSILIIIVCVKGGPSFIKPCSLSDSKLNECALKNANEVIPIIIKGDKEFKIPNLAPVRIPLITIDAPNLQIKFTDVSSNVLSQITATKINIDDKAKKWSFTLETDVFEVIGNCDIKGRISILATNGQGPANITYVKPVYTHTITYKEVERNGGTYLDFVNSENKLEFERVYFKFDNIIGGNKKIVDEMNAFLNENWKTSEKELHSVVLQTIGGTVDNVLKQIFAKVSKSEIFLR